MRDWSQAPLSNGQSFDNRPLRCVNALCGRLAQFRRNDDGAMGLLTVFVFLLMLSMAGLATDLMRHEITRARMQATLDNALASVANLEETRDPKLVIEDYLAKQNLDSAIGSVTATDDTAKLTTRSISASVDNDISTVFMRMAGVDNLTMHVEAGAVEAQEHVEVSLILDVSQSMQTGSRIDHLRPAAKEFVSTLLRGEAANTTSINLIPYAGQTNPGPTMFDMLGGVRYGTTGENLFPASWGATQSTVFYYQRNTALEEEVNYTDGTDYYVAPGVYTVPATYDYTVMTTDYPAAAVPEFDAGDLDSYIFFLDAYHKRHDANLSDSASLVGVSFIDDAGASSVYGLNGAALAFLPITDAVNADATATFNAFHAEVIGQVSSCLELTADDFLYAALPAAGSYAQTPHFTQGAYDANTMDWGWCPEDDMQIQYAQNDPTSLSAFLDGLRLHDGEGKKYAMRYGLALLDPSSGDAFAQLAQAGEVPAVFAAGPKAWSNPDVAKYIVLISDGAASSQLRPAHKYAPVNTSTTLTAQPYYETTTLSSTTESRNSFYASCDLAKKNGVEVFTISFGAGTAGAAEMFHCASSSSHAFSATGADISDVLATISRRVTQLKLTH